MTIFLAIVEIDKVYCNFSLLTLSFGNFKGSLLGINWDDEYIAIEILFHSRVFERKKKRA